MNGNEEEKINMSSPKVDGESKNKKPYEYKSLRITYIVLAAIFGFGTTSGLIVNSKILWLCIIGFGWFLFGKRRYDRRKLPLSLRFKWTAAVLVVILISAVFGSVYRAKKFVTYVENLTPKEIAELQGLEDEYEAYEMKQTNEEKFLKHYSDDLYWGDYSEETLKINREHEKIVLMELENIINESEYDSLDFFVKSDIQCYNQSLKDLQENELTITDILENEIEHIMSVKFDVYYFKEEEIYQSPFEKKIKELKTFYENKDIYFEVNLRGFGPEILTKITMESMKQMDKPYTVLNSYLGLYAIKQYSSKEEKFGYHLMTNGFEEKISEEKRIKQVQSLSEKYNQQFIFLNPNPEGGRTLYAPSKDVSLKFEASGKDDKYATVMAQRMISIRINEILHKHEANDKIVLYILINPSTGKDYELDRMEVDFSEMDDLEFINNKLTKGPSIALYYLLTKNEEIDYKLLKAIVDDYYDLYPNHEHPRFILHTYFVRLPDDKRKIAIDLFKGKDITEFFFREKLAYFRTKDGNIIRENHEGFQFLDVYGELQSFSVWVNGSVKEKTSEKFIEENVLDILAN